MVSGTLKQLVDVDFGTPLHSLVLIGSQIHFLEAYYLRQFAVDVESLNMILKRDYDLKE